MKRKKFLVKDSHEIIDRVLKSKTIKVIKVTIIIVGGLYAFGLGCKILNFSMKNYLQLKNTLQLTKLGYT